MLKINYHACLRDPAKVARQIAKFLGQNLDQAAMTRAVDPSLYRQRLATDDPVA